MDYYSEEKFYQNNGWPPERLDYCDYIFYIDNETEYGPDYDQFALVVNATYPYIRLTKKRGRYHFPCGLSDSPAPESTYAQKPETERNLECPKIAWGIAAVFLANLKYDNNQKDYVLLKDQNALFEDYYEKYWNLYKSLHNGLRLSNISNEQKELDFLKEHLDVICRLWEKSESLKKIHRLV